MNEPIIREAVRNSQNDYAQRWAQVVSKFATALTGQRIDCTLSNQTIAPAWSSESSIWLSEPQLPDLLTPHGVLVAKGLALHELGHILFTPRNATQWSRTVRAEGLQSAMNILEDMRLESMLVARHRGSVSPWLTALILHYLLADTKTIPMAFPLIHGRKFLPVAIRQDVRDAYEHQHIVPDLVRIIDEYRKVILPRDTDRSLDLIREFKRVLDSVKPTGEGEGEGGTGEGQPQPPQGGCEWESSNPNHPDGRPESYTSDPDHKPLSDKEQEQLTDRMDETNDGGETDESPAKDEPEDESATNNGDDADTDADTDADADGGDSSDSTSDTDADGDSDSTDADGDSTDADADGDSTDGDSFGGSDADGDSTDEQGEDGAGDPTSGDSTGGQSAGNEAGNNPAVTNMQEALDAIAQSLSDAISQVQEQVGITPDLELLDEQVAIRQAQFNAVPMTDSKLGYASIAMAEELERLRAEHEPAWERETKTGRLNPSRLVNDPDTEVPFDRWNDGQDDVTAVEAVILLDNSGSMAGDNATNAYRSMFALKSALDLLGDARCTVVTFNQSHSLLYSADEVAGATIRDAGAMGGTYATGALTYATNVLAKSEQPIKLLFAITDGAWGDKQSADDLIVRMRNAGVLTAIAQVGGQSNDAHECEVYSEVNNTSDLLVLGRKLVSIAVDRNLAR